MGDTAILEDDFVSISNSNDFDFYSFATSDPSLVDIVLNPVGPTYSEKINNAPTVNVNSMSISNLGLEFYKLVGESPTLLASVNANPVGLGESILDFALEEPGEYFVRIAGNASFAQLYQLSLSAELLEINEPGDFDGDGDVDGGDFLAWQRGDSTNPFSPGDLEQWQEHYGMGGELIAVVSVPEPASSALFLVALFGIARRPLASSKSSRKV